MHICVSLVVVQAYMIAINDLLSDLLVLVPGVEEEVAPVRHSLVEQNDL